MNFFVKSKNVKIPWSFEIVVPVGARFLAYVTLANFLHFRHKKKTGRTTADTQARLYFP